MYTLQQEVLQKLSLCPPLQSRKWRQEFLEKEKKVALLFCHAKGPQKANALKTVPLWTGLGGGFIVWGVENRAANKDQGRGKFALSFKAGVQWPPGLVLVVLLPGMRNASSSSSSICCRFQFWRKAQRYCYVYSLRRNQDPAPRLHYCPGSSPRLLLLGLCIPSLP